MATLDQLELPDGTTYGIKGVYRGIVDASSTSTNFIVSAEGVSSLYDGLTLTIKNTKIASAANCTINVNGLGAKRIWVSQGNGYCTTHWGLNQTYLFIYDLANERWELQQGRDTDSNDTSTVRPYYTNPTVGSNGIKQYSLFGMTSNGTYSSFITNSGTGAKTFDTNTFYDIRKIYYYNGSDNVASGASLGNNTFTKCVNLFDLRYNYTGVTTSASTSSIVAKKPLYIVWNKTSWHGYHQLRSPYYTQTPDDTGAIYTLIGYPYDSYRCDLIMINHAFKYDGTRLMPYICDADDIEAYSIYGGIVQGHISVENSNSISSFSPGASSEISGYFATNDATLKNGKLYISNGGTKISGSGSYSKSMDFSNSDIVFNKYESGGASVNVDTWDGTNTSLKTAITELKNGKLSLTGGIMTGKINWMPDSEDASNTGLYWKEDGYGDKFAIYPKFAGSEDNNTLSIYGALGGTGTDPELEEFISFLPNGIIRTVSQSYVSVGRPTIDTSTNNHYTSTANYASGLEAVDANNWYLARFKGWANNSGDTAAVISARNYKTDGTLVQNNFNVKVKKDGSMIYEMSSPSAFRSALELGTASTLNTSGTYTSTGTEVFTRAGAHNLYNDVISANNRLHSTGYKKWMAANETQSNIAGSNGCGIIFSAGRMATYQVAGNAGSLAVTITEIGSGGAIGNWFTITCNATTGLLTVKNKSTAARYFVMIGVI